MRHCWLFILFAFTAVRSPSPAPSEDEFDWTSFLVKSPDSQVSGQEPLPQEVHPIQEESSKLDVPKEELPAKAGRKRKQRTIISDEQAKLRKKQSNQKWWKNYIHKVKADPEALEAYRTKFGKALYTRKAETITDPVERDIYLKKARETASNTKKRYYQRRKAKTGFGSRQGKRYHDSALAVKAGTATEDQIKLVQEKRSRSRENYHKRRIAHSQKKEVR